MQWGWGGEMGGLGLGVGLSCRGAGGDLAGLAGFGV